MGGLLLTLASALERQQSGLLAALQQPLPKWVQCAGLGAWRPPLRGSRARAEAAVAATSAAC